MRSKEEVSEHHGWPVERLDEPALPQEIQELKDVLTQRLADADKELAREIRYEKARADHDAKEAREIQRRKDGTDEARQPKETAVLDWSMEQFRNNATGERVTKWEVLQRPSTVLANHPYYKSELRPTENRKEFIPLTREEYFSDPVGDYFYPPNKDNDWATDEDITDIEEMTRKALDDVDRRLDVLIKEWYEEAYD
jgi:hypothetical protein